MIIHSVFFLCSVTSVGCAVLLFRSYLKARSRLLLWSSLCFAAFALSNILLFIDLAIMTSVDMSLYRNLLTFIGLALLVYGLVVDS